MSTDPDTQAPTATDVQPMLAERVGYLFAKLHQRWAAESAAVLRDAGVGLSGMHFGALSIVDSAGPMSQQALGELIGKDRTSIVAIVDDLEGEGLVERRRNPADRRAYALEVTRRGEDWLQRARPVLFRAEDELLADLGEGERRQLIALLQRVLLGPRAPR
jgi:DNA-binding MarR family transcriptional regulator